MNSSSALVAAIVDLVAIATLAFAIYYRRHFRRDMVLSYVGLNVAVFVVIVALANAPATSATGLGLGLFGVLSIVRLRSSEVTHTEIAYYFVSLALGLLCGIHPEPLWTTPVLSVALVVMMFAVDHPGLHRNGRHQIITLDTAFTNEVALRSRLESLLGADVQQVTITGLDLVRDTTTVDVRYRLRPTTSHDSVAPAPDRASR